MKNRGIETVLAIVLAGGLGTRLSPLTGEDPDRDRPKPNTPIEKRRFLDFVVSNCIHSALVKACHVLAQAHPNKVIAHIQDAYSHFAKEVRAQVVPMVEGSERFKGTLDAIRKSRWIFSRGFKHILVLAGDHVYTMKYDELIQQHTEERAHVTIVVKRVPQAEAGELGVFTVDESGQVLSFTEKPANKGLVPAVVPGTTESLCSLGIYIFQAGTLQEITGSCDGDDFGHDVISMMLQDPQYTVNLFTFEGYWKDAGNPRSLWEANMDLISPTPALNLYNPDHPILHKPKHLPSPKLINGATAKDSIVSDGCIVAGQLESCVLSPGVRIGCNASLRESVIFDNVKIGAGARLTRVISDKDVQIGERIVLGDNPEQDVKNWPDQLVLRDGILIIRRGSVIGNPTTF